MAGETPQTPRLQPDPAEGDRDRVDRELKRQERKEGAAPDQGSDRGRGERGGP